MGLVYMEKYTYGSSKFQGRKKSWQENLNFVPLRNSNYHREAAAVCISKEHNKRSIILRGVCSNCPILHGNTGNKLPILLSKVRFEGLSPNIYSSTTKLFISSRELINKKFALLLEQKDHFLFHVFKFIKESFQEICRSGKVGIRPPLLPWTTW